MSFTMDQYERDMDRMWRNFWIAIVSVIVIFVVFISTVVIPSNNRQRESCEAKGGVIVSKSHTCVKKESVL